MEDLIIGLLLSSCLLYAYRRRAQTEEVDLTDWTAEQTAVQTTPADTAPRFTDPKDTAAWLQQHGWEQVTATPERYLGRYQADGVTMLGGLERTASGRRKFLVTDPPESFTQRVHEGRCLLDREDLAANTYELHFNTPPDSFGDGIAEIEALLEDANA